MKRIEYIEKRKKQRPENFNGLRLETYTRKAENNVIIWPVENLVKPEKNPYALAIVIWAMAFAATCYFFFTVFKSFV